jgi:hypothetical protein
MVFSMLQKHHGSYFPYCCRVPLAIPFGCFKMPSFQFQFQFQFGEQSEITGTKSGERGGWEMIIMLLLVTNYVVFRDVWAGVVS